MIVKEVFSTIQGEGFHTGTPATFVRLAGCNLWTGKQCDRKRQATDTVRCPLWCDTDFVGGRNYERRELAGVVEGHQNDLVVFTGGEPLLQLGKDATVVRLLEGRGMKVAIETNGTVALGDLAKTFAWVTVSPKVAPLGIVVRQCDELKVVVPHYDPLSFGFIKADHRFVQPADDRDQLPENTLFAVRFAQQNRGWRVSIQAHKVMGVP